MLKKAGRLFSRSGLIWAPSELPPDGCSHSAWYSNEGGIVTYFIWTSSVVLFILKSLTVSGLWLCLEKLENFSLGGEKEARIRLNGTNEWSYSLGPASPSNFIPNIHRNVFPQFRDWNFTLWWCCLESDAQISRSQQATDLALEPPWLAFAKVHEPYGPMW